MRTKEEILNEAAKNYNQDKRIVEALVDIRDILESIRKSHS